MDFHEKSHNQIKLIHAYRKTGTEENLNISFIIIEMYYVNDIEIIFVRL